MIRILLLTGFAVELAVDYGALAHAGRVPLARPELVPFIVFLVATAGGMFFSRKFGWFAVAAPLLAVALVMRGVFAGPALYGNYATFATLYALFASARTSIDPEAKRYRFGVWARNALLLSGAGWATFLISVQIASP